MRKLKMTLKIEKTIGKTIEVTEEHYARFKEKMEMSEQNYKDLREQEGEPTSGSLFYDLEKIAIEDLTNGEEYVEESFTINEYSY